MTHVLYVEDTEEMQRMYSYALIQEGFEVTVANSVTDAFTKLKNEPCDILLLDLMMPGMSGLDFLNFYAGEIKRTGAKVIILSNYDNPNIIDRAKKLGVTDYLVKAQYEPKALADYLKTLIAGPNASATTPSTTTS